METAATTQRVLNEKLIDWFSEQVLCHEPRMLVVEDDRDLEPVLRRVVQSMRPDVLVDWAGDARTARALLGSRFYDIVLVDQCLGEEDSGLSLRGQCWEKQPQAIFAAMSVWPLSDYLLSVGGEGIPFLRKPFTLPECRAFLRSLLRIPRRVKRR
jgi:DNA-binding response OmpR family regulator